MLQCQQPAPEDGEVIMRRVRLGLPELVVEVERGGGEDGAWEDGRGLFLAAEAETVPARGKWRGADGFKERVDVFDDDVAGGVRRVVVGGVIMAVRRCCCC